MATEGMGPIIGPVVVLMGAAVVAVPLFRRLGLGSVLGYFAAGILVGPSVLALFADPGSVLHFAELGVVMFLFLIGLELQPNKLWAMRGQIVGLGLAQVGLALTLLTLGAHLGFGLPLAPAFVAASGIVMSSTAVIMSILQERGESASPEGQKAVSILLFEDLMIVPLLAIVAWLGSRAGGAAVEGAVEGAHEATHGGPGILVGLGAVVALIVAGRYLLDPFFGLLARARTREVLTAGALLVVLGAALLMEASGLSMAMGAFIAGVMLSGSSYRHQIESDIEPFKGLLMGLFFLAVGMSLNLRILAAEWLLLIEALVVMVALKAVAIYVVARLSGSANAPALTRTAMFAQGGEFAFVIYLAANQGGVISDYENVLFSTVIILSMALTPLVLMVADRLLRPTTSLEGVSEARDLRGQVLLIGFGRVGQIAAQMLLARGVEVSIIETDPDRIRDVAPFGFKIHYGDGTRLDILHHSGAAEAEVIAVCVDDRKAALQIVELVQHEFPMARLVVRAYDRPHAIELIRAGADTVLRETYDSALLIGGEVLKALGSDAETVVETEQRIRRLDAERLAAQVQTDLLAGHRAVSGDGSAQAWAAATVPEPLTGPARGH